VVTTFLGARKVLQNKGTLI